MPMINEKDLQSCLRYFLANSSSMGVCPLYLEEILSRDETFQVTIAVSPNTAKLTPQNATLSRAAGKVGDTRKKKDEGDRLQAFKAQVLSKHGDRAEVINKTSIKCLYQENCKKVLHKKFDMQKFDTDVSLGHKSKKKQGGDIRMLLTTIGQTYNPSQKSLATLRRKPSPASPLSMLLQ